MSASICCRRKLVAVLLLSTDRWGKRGLVAVLSSPWWAGVWCCSALSWLVCSWPDPFFCRIISLMGSVLSGAGVNPADQHWPWWPLLPPSSLLLELVWGACPWFVSRFLCFQPQLCAIEALDYFDVPFRSDQVDVGEGRLGWYLGWWFWCFWSRFWSFWVFSKTKTNVVQFLQQTTHSCNNWRPNN